MTVRYQAALRAEHWKISLLVIVMNARYPQTICLIINQLAINRFSSVSTCNSNASSGL
ncbi:ABC transporter permease [Pantoea sp. S62]|nr:ABC transporter permease [Pantoea sp. S62]